MPHPITSPSFAHSMSDAAKLVGIGPRALFAQLRERHIIDHNNMPFQRYISLGYFRVFDGTWHHPRMGMQHYAKTKVTAKGIDFIRRELGLDDNGQEQEVRHG